MALFEEWFYHQTIKYYTGIFGTVFDNMKITRSDGKVIKVPISYAGQQKENTRLENYPDSDRTRYRMRLPRMAFALTGWQKDETRITNKMHTIQQRNVDRTAATGVTSQLNRVPYNFNFELRVKTKHIDDMLQIVEQILPYFNPSIKITVKDNPDLDSSTAVELTLMDSNLENDYEGSFEEGREIESVFNFTLEGYLYTKSSESAIIKEVIINYHDLLNPDDIIETDTFTEDDL